MSASGFSFAAMSRSWKVLITGFVLILGAGFLAGALNAALSVGIRPSTIADHYMDHEAAAKVALEAQGGFVEEEFSFDDPEPEVAEAAAMGSMSIKPQQMAQLAHVHLLGFAMILLSAGVLACLSGLSESFKTALVGGLFLALGSDIGGLYLVRFVSPGFATLNMAGGITIGICLLIITVRVLWEVWLEPIKQ